MDAARPPCDSTRRLTLRFASLRALGAIRQNVCMVGKKTPKCSFFSGTVRTPRVYVPYDHCRITHDMSARPSPYLSVRDPVEHGHAEQIVQHKRRPQAHRHRGRGLHHPRRGGGVGDWGFRRSVLSFLQHVLHCTLSMRKRRGEKKGYRYRRHMGQENAAELWTNQRPPGWRHI